MCFAGGNIDGYLFQITRETTRIVYCILDEGMLQVYSHMGGTLLDVYALTGSKVRVCFVPSALGQVPHQFRLETKAKAIHRRSNHENIYQQQVRPKSTYFAGATAAISEQWAVSLLNWNRYLWEDPQTICSSKDEHAALVKILASVNYAYNQFRSQREFKRPKSISPASSMGSDTTASSSTTSSSRYSIHKARTNITSSNMYSIHKTRSRCF